MFEIREETDRFFILAFRDEVSVEEMKTFVGQLRDLVRDSPEKLLFLTDLRGSMPWSREARDEFAFAMRMGNRKVKANVLVAEAGSDMYAEAERLVADGRSDARRVVPDLNDARRELVDHFGPAEDFAFEKYYREA